MFDEVYERMVANSVRDEETGCLIYLGQTDGKDDPYGRISYRGYKIATHIASWKHHKKRIPKGYEIDHKCVRRLCIEINHLQAVTKSKNAKLREKRKAYRHDAIRCLAVK